MELVVINLNDASDLVRYIVILIFLQASQGDKSWLTVGMIKRCEKNSVFTFCSQSYVVQWLTIAIISELFARNQDHLENFVPSLESHKLLLILIWIKQKNQNGRHKKTEIFFLLHPYSNQ